jgi:hypothetical protein
MSTATTDPASSTLTTANDPQTVTVPIGGTGTATDVGFQFQGTIDGHVFEDVDGDGVQGAGEPDLAGVDVTLTPAGGGAPITVTTDVNGDYSSSARSAVPVRRRMSGTSSRVRSTVMCLMTWTVTVFRVRASPTSRGSMSS